MPSSQDPDPNPMILEGFRVRMYRSIRDSGFVPVFPLTALVGREQSGKTSLLQAMRGLDPALHAPYVVDHDWPRGARQRRAAEQVVCSATLRLSERARERFVAEGAATPETCGVRIGRTYGGDWVLEAWTGEAHDEVPNGVPNPSVSPELAVFAKEHLPVIVFAAHDAFLAGAIPGDVLAAPRTVDEDTGAAALARLLGTAGLEPDELRGGPAPARVRKSSERIRALLAARGLPSELELDVDRGRVLLFLRVGGVRTALDKLSKDLRYSVTLAVRLASAGEAPLLLLDGPGRSFRRHSLPKMRALFDRCVAAGATLVYTSRLPFEIELQHSEQVLVLAPAREGSMVAGGQEDAGERLALRAALGMTGRTSFLVNDLNLVVEGPSDAGVLRALDDLLRRSGEPGLPSDVSVTSAQGSYEVVAVSRFLARQGLGVIALLDSDHAGRIASDELRRVTRKDTRMERVQVLLLGDAAGLDVADAAIEDIFPADYYMETALEVCGPKAAEMIASAMADDEPGTSAGNPAFHLTKTFEAQGQRFPKGKVSEVLGARLAAMSSVKELPAGMPEPVHRLVRTLRSAANLLRSHREEPDA